MLDICIIESLFDHFVEIKYSNRNCLFDKENNVIHFNAEVMYCMIAVYHSTVRYTLHHDK